MSKSTYTVSSVYYNNLDSGQHTRNGKSYKSYQHALKDFNLLWDENDTLSFANDFGKIPAPNPKTNASPFFERFESFFNT